MQADACHRYNLENDAWNPSSHVFASAYLDHVVIFSKTMVQHMEHLKILFKLISKQSLHLKVPKCDFSKAEVNLLGHIVKAERVALSPDKIEVIKNAPVSHDGTTLRSFLGLSGYYRPFTKEIAEKSFVLSKTTSRKTRFEWTGDLQEAIENLEEKLITVLCLLSQILRNLSL